MSGILLCTVGGADRRIVSNREVNTMRIAGRGSEWHRWEPHVHALGTVREDRYPASGWDAYLAALETASPPLAAIGITDYCVSRSYENVKSERENGRPRNCSLLFPNIELRLNTGTVKATSSISIFSCLLTIPTTSWN